MIGTQLEMRLMLLCDEHYARYRRVVTSLAVPVGTQDEMRKSLKDDHMFFPGGKCHVVLYTPHEVVNLEELPGLTKPAVLSDRVPRSGAGVAP